MPFDLSTAKPVAQPKFDLQSAKPTLAATAPSDSLIEQKAGVGESILTALTGMIAKPVSDIAGLAAVGHDLITGEQDGNPEGFKREVQDSLTYSPRTQTGKKINQAASDYVGKPVDKALTYAADKITPGDSDVARAGVKEALGQGLGIVAAKLPLGRVAAAADDAASSVASRVARAEPAPAAPTGTSIPDNPIEGMRAAGIKLSPSAAAKAQGGGAKVRGQTMEAFAGPGQLGKDIAEHNQVRITQLGAKELGLPEDSARITPKMLDEKRAPHIETYGKVGEAVGDFAPSDALTREFDSISQQTGLSPPARANIAADVDQYRADKLKGPDVVKTISALRRRSMKELQSEDVNTQDLGAAHRKVADALENELGRQAEMSLQPELVQQLQGARTALAKINDVDSMVKGGQVDPKVALRLRQKGVKLSGNLGVIADAAEYGAPVVKHTQSMATAEQGISPSAILSPTLDVATAGLRPLARKILASDKFQNKMGTPAADTATDPRLGDYFAKPETPATAPVPQYDTIPPTPASSMLEAQRLGAGRLQLAPEQMPNAQPLPPPPGPLTADTPPPTPTGGLPFTPGAPSLADLLAGDLSLAPEASYGSIPGGASPRAAGMSEMVPGTSLHPELRAVRSAPAEQATPDTGIQVQEHSLTDALGLPEGVDVRPSTKRPGYMTVYGPDGKPAFDIPANPEANAIEARARQNLENNASGESAASQEAISRVAEENAKGRQRYLIDKDGSIRPLVGVDAVDTVAKPGQVIVQRNVGANEFTVWDRGGLSKQLAEGKLTRAMPQLKAPSDGTR